jgi:hypothetical protein
MVHNRCIREGVMIGRIGVSLGLGLLLLAAAGCEEGPKKGPRTGREMVAESNGDIPGACECAIECAHTTMIDDDHGLQACKAACSKEFGAKSAAKGFKRAVEVMSRDRESCDD